MIVIILWCAPNAWTVGIGDDLGISPFLDWKTMETEHFRLTFPESLTDTSKVLAQYLEDAHAAISPVLKWTPKYRTQIVVIDNSDAANGMASPFERFGIVMQVTPPENFFSTNAYDDWLRILAFHEYTHILNMDTTTSWVYRGLRTLFGDTFLPNTLWPSWMLEGLAVYMETRNTGGGRGRSSFYEMILRSGVEAGLFDDSKWITLDKINGENPYYPGGETAYLFGYQMMNQVAKKNGDEALGEMSYRSGGRFPFFINGNLENITGKDWYGFWADFVRETKDRMNDQIGKIKAQGASEYELLTQSKYFTLGVAASRNEKWIAYNESSLSRQNGLFLKDMQSGKTKRLDNRRLGVSIAFSPDSSKIFYSSLRQKDLYSIYSDLRVFDINSDKAYWLTDGLRARDPDITPDGKTLVFSITEQETTLLAKADLITNGDRLTLGPITRLYVPEHYGRVSTPKVSPDGKKIAFSVHSNTRNAEELMELPIDAGTPKVIAENGHYNRFPAYRSDGALFYVSDKTGVDNVYKDTAHGAEQITNVITGVWAPAFRGQKLLGSVLRAQGWELVQFKETERVFNSDKLLVSAPPAPTPKIESSVAPTNLEVKDYSVYPSILPRQWAPYLFLGTDYSIIGGEVFGFDAVDRHRYLLAGTYASDIERADWIAMYSNRSFGVDFTAQVVQQWDPNLTNTILHDSLDYSVTLSYPFKFTESKLTPELEFKKERDRYQGYLGGGTTTAGKALYSDDSITGSLSYTDTETSRLAVTSERGRLTKVGARWYHSNYDDPNVTKALFSDREYFELWDHWVLTPAIKTSFVSEKRGLSQNSNVQVKGKSNSLIGSLSSDLLESLPLRGYPRQVFQARAASVFSADLVFPVSQIFRGLGTNPLFFEQLKGNLFVEDAYFHDDNPGEASLASAGGGLSLSTQVLTLFPISFSLQYHQGFQVSMGGKSEVFFVMDLGSFDF